MRVCACVGWVGPKEKRDKHKYLLIIIKRDTVVKVPGEICTASASSLHNVCESNSQISQLVVIIGIHRLRDQSREIQTLPFVMVEGKKKLGSDGEKKRGKRNRLARSTGRNSAICW